MTFDLPGAQSNFVKVIPFSEFNYGTPFFSPGGRREGQDLGPEHRQQRRAGPASPHPAAAARLQGCNSIVKNLASKSP